MIKFPLLLKEVADICSGTVIGDPALPVYGVSSIDTVAPNHITYVSHDSLVKKIAQECCGMYIIKPEWVENIEHGIVCDNPTKAFRLLLTALYGYKPDHTLQSTAIIATTAQLGEHMSIGHYSHIGDNVVLGNNVIIGSHCCIGDGVTIADNTRLDNHVVIHNNCVIGKECVIGSGTIIGGQGFGFSFEAGHWEPIPQIGRVVIGDHVHIGNGSCIDRGAINDTIIGNNVIIDNLVHIAHNVTIGDHSAIAAGFGVAGSTDIGKYCMFGGQVGIAGHISIADGVQINGGAKVLKPIKVPGTYAGSFNVMPVRQWNRLSVYIKKLETLFRREKTSD